VFSSKKKYIYSYFFPKLSKYGFFNCFDALWKYSQNGQYVIKLSTELTRYGTINEIIIEFGSFYTPIKYESECSKNLALANRFCLAYFVRNVDLGYPLLNLHLSLEEQIDSIMPYFDRFIYPYIQIGDNLTDYISMAEQFIDMQITAFQGFPRGIEIDEIVYSNLSLNNVSEAVRLLSKYALRYKYAEKYIQHNSDSFYKPTIEIDFWKGKYDSAMAFIEMLKSDNLSSFQELLLSREKQSQEVCSTVFANFTFDNIQKKNT